MKKFIFCILFLLSRSPVLSVTLDKCFHNIRVNDFYREEFSYKELRFSIFSLGLGVVKVYLLTYSRDEGFKIFKFLKLSNVTKLSSEDVIKEKLAGYSQHINNKQENGSDIELEIDFIKYKIESCENTKNIAIEKANTYLTIVSVLIPLFFASGLKFVLDIKSNILLTTITIVISYNLINIIFFLFDFYRVKSYPRSLFGPLRESQDHLKKLAESYYWEWYSIKEEAPLFVTYVSNIERYVKYLLIFVVLFIFLSNINLNSKISVSKLNNIYTTSLVKEISISQNGSISNTDLSKLIDVQSALINNETEQIIIIAKEKFSNELIHKKYQSIINILDTYNVNKVGIDEVLEDNSTVQDKNDSIKILILGGRK